MYDKETIDIKLKVKSKYTNFNVHFKDPKVATVSLGFH